MGYLVGALAGFGALLIVWSWSAHEKTISILMPKSTKPRSVRSHAREFRRRSEAWPDVVDDVASGIRAGLSLPQAVFLIGDHGPESFREPFVASARNYVDSCSFVSALNHLQTQLADPIGDRFVVAIKVAYELGGSDLGSLMRSLADSIREEIKLRGELAARQSWTINGARLAVAAPWVTAAVLSLRSDAISAYTSPGGLRLLATCLVFSFVAYRVMLRVGRLPTGIRVFT